MDRFLFFDARSIPRVSGGEPDIPITPYKDF